MNATDPSGMCTGGRIGSATGSICSGSNGLSQKPIAGNPGASKPGQERPIGGRSYGATEPESGSSGNNGQSMYPTTACDMQNHCYANDPAAQPDGSIHVGLSAGGATAFTRGATVSLPSASSVGSHVGLVTLVAQDNSTPGPLIFTASGLKNIAKDIGGYMAKTTLTGPGARIQIYANGKPFGREHTVPLGTGRHVQVPDHTPLRFSFTVEGNQLTTGVIVHRGYYVRGP